MPAKKPAKKKAAAPRPVKAAPKKRLGIGEQAAEHAVLIHVPLVFFGTKEQVVKDTDRLIETLRIKGYDVGTNWSVSYGATVDRAAKAPEIKTGEGSP